LLKPTVTGNYTFDIASDDSSRLFLSTDATAANKVDCFCCHWLLD
jgi:hypothetical protein